jgi:hypothetical protein
MDEIEQQRRRDLINEIRAGNRAASDLEEACLVAREPRVDPMVKWKAEADEAERQVMAELKNEKQQRALDEVEERIRSALLMERQFVLDIVGEAIGELLEKERDAAKSELTSEIQKLWAIIADLQATIAALNRTALAVGGKRVVDMDDPLSRSH